MSLSQFHANRYAAVSTSGQAMDINHIKKIEYKLALNGSTDGAVIAGCAFEISSALPVPSHLVLTGSPAALHCVVR